MKNASFVNDARGIKILKDIQNLCLEHFGAEPVLSTCSVIKQKILALTDGVTTKAFSGIDSWLKLFEAGNPGSVTSFIRDENGVFVSCMLSHSSAIDILKNSAYSVCYLDAGFTHVKGWRGQILVFEGTDGDHGNIPFAIGLYGVESAANYTHFLTEIMKMGDGHMGEIMNSPTMTIFTDRHKAFVPALTNVMGEANHMFDLLHIVRNMLDKGILSKDTGSDLVWSIGKARTKATFNAKLSELQALNLKAFTYLDAIPHEKWAFYIAAERGMVLWGKFGSNDVESEMNRLKLAKVRHSLPLHALINFARLITDLLSKRSRKVVDLQQNEQELVPSALKHHNDALMRSRSYVAHHNANYDEGGFQVHHVNALTVIRMVNWKEKTCECLEPQQRRRFCHHLYCVAAKLNVIVASQTMFNSIYFTVFMAEAYRGYLNMPNIEEIVEDDTKQPPYKKRRGPAEQARMLGRNERHYKPLKKKHFDSSTVLIPATMATAIANESHTGTIDSSSSSMEDTNFVECYENMPYLCGEELADDAPHEPDTTLILFDEGLEQQVIA
jgi:hypothetical protein